MSKIKEKRMEAGLSRRAFSKLTEIPYRTIQHWEEGDRNPSAWVENLILEKLDRMVEERKMLDLTSREELTLCDMVGRELNKLSVILLETEEPLEVQMVEEMIGELMEIKRKLNS